MEGSGSHSSQSSSSTWATGGHGPPLPYREGPFEYEPVVMCNCRMKAAKLTSWTEENPGLRYYRCRRARTGSDCGYFEWIDGTHTSYMKKLVVDLCKMIWKLKEENGELLQQLKNVEELKRLNNDLMMENAAKCDELNAIQKELAERDAILEAMAKKSARGPCSSVSWILCAYVLGLFFGVVLGVVIFG
ncbi:hypothetical protein BS78_06G022500 [Paspalum vaginatum]|nr:hypothetical protein BS78_06G022500 [Paspalum vaginatum]